MKSDESVSRSTITGTGEFWRKELHVIASVEVHGGIIRSLGFALDDGSAIEGAEEIVDLLTDRSVHDALEVHADPEAIAADSRLGIEAREVLFEAFHRAVEACLDHQ